MAKTKKILLINPMNVATVSGTTVIPAGLAYLASMLIKRGHLVRCFDLQVEAEKDLSPEIASADIVGITALTPTIKEAWRLARLAKEKGKLVLLGGPHPSVLPEESLKTGLVDIVCRKEAEHTIVEIADNDIPLEKIQGISFLKNGVVVHNDDRPYIENLDEFPFPARELFPLNRYKAFLHKGKNSMWILTSRGCPYDCNFCYKGISGWKYRMRSVENILVEWEQMIRQGADGIGTLDDSFTVDKQRVIKLSEALIRTKMNIFWESGSRVDTVDRDMLFKMKESGYWRIAYGIESGSQKILDTIGKGITKEQARNAVKWAKEAGIEVMGLFVLGNYGEDENTINETIEFAKSLPLDYVQFTNATPYPGTRLYKMVQENGRFLFKDWDEFSPFSGRAYFEQGSVTKELVERMFKQAYRRVYFTPRMIFKKLRTFNPQMLRYWRMLR